MPYAILYRKKDTTIDWNYSPIMSGSEKDLEHLKQHLENLPPISSKAPILEWKIKELELPAVVAPLPIPEPTPRVTVPVTDVPVETERVDEDTLPPPDETPSDL